MPVESSHDTETEKVRSYLFGKNMEKEFKEKMKTMNEQVKDLTDKNTSMAQKLITLDSLMPHLIDLYVYNHHHHVQLW